MGLLGTTESTCAVCRRLVPARIEAEDDAVFFRKFCPEHGESRDHVWNGVSEYLKAQRFVKSAWKPRRFSGDTMRACGEGCGFCERHEQHLCMPIIEITERCDLSCPICLVSAGKNRDMCLADFRRILDGILAAEAQIDVLNLSGGEPLLHPELLEFIDEALGRQGIIRVSISTNGLSLLSRPGLLAELKKRNVVISLQFDGFDDRTYEAMRGERLLERKLKLLALLKESGISSSLTMTLAAGQNERELRPVLDLLFSSDNIISLMLQPLSLAGRAANFGETKRLSIPDVLRLIDEAGHPHAKSGDFLPLPCSHPLCFSLAFYLMLNDGTPIPTSRLIEAESFLDSIANRVVFGLDKEEHEKLKSMIYDLWSGPAASAPDSKKTLETLRSILKEISCQCSGFDPQKAFKTMERRVKSIFIHAFQDAHNFDLARVRKCCQAYPQADGRLIPACVNNVMMREGRK